MTLLLRILKNSILSLALLLDLVTLGLMGCMVWVSTCRWAFDEEEDEAHPHVGQLLHLPPSFVVIHHPKRLAFSSAFRKIQRLLVDRSMLTTFEENHHFKQSDVEEIEYGTPYTVRTAYHIKPSFFAKDVLKQPHTEYVLEDKNGKLFVALEDFISTAQ